MSSIPKNVKKLSLDNCFLRRKMISVFKFMPSNITDLSIKDIGLDGCEKNELVQFFKAIPSSVKTLDLSDSRLASNTDFIGALSSLPRGVSTLKLNDNRFNRVSFAEFIALCEALPEGVKDLTLDYNDVARFTSEQFEQIGGALKYLVNIHFKDIPESKPNPEIKEELTNNPIDKIGLLRSRMRSWIVKAHKELSEVAINAHNEDRLPKELSLTVMSFFAPKGTKIAPFIQNHPEYVVAQPTITPPAPRPFFNSRVISSIGVAGLAGMAYMFGMMNK